jgi:hypothetical protein
MKHRELDGGFKSRKLLVVLFSMVLVTGVAIAAGIYTNLTSVYPTLCTTVCTLAGLYLGANTITRHITKDLVTTPDPTEPDKK